MFMDAHLFQSEWRERNNLNMAYPDGVQWTNEEAEIIEGRGQQATVLNICRPTVDMVVAQASQQKTDIQIVGREISDDETAGVLTELLKHVYDMNDYAYYELQVLRTGVTGGCGWFQVKPEEDETGTIQIVVEEVPWEEVYWDPYFRKPDGSDMRFCIRQVWMDIDRAKRKWPSAMFEFGGETSGGSFGDTFDGHEESAQSRTTGQSFSYFDQRKRRVAIHEVYYKDEKGQLRHCIYSGSEFLKGGEEDGQNQPPYGDFNEIPMVPFMASRNKIGEPQGRIEWIRPIQDSLNKLYSKWQWNIMSRQIIADTNACEDWDEVREEVKRPDGLILTNQGMAGSISIQKNIEESAHMSNMMQFLIGMSQRVSGVNDAMIGAGGVNARSAEQEASRMIQGSAMQTSIMDNLMFTKKRVAKLILRMIGEYYTDERIVRVVRPNGERDYYALNTEFQDKSGNTIIYKINDILKYDVTLKLVPAFNSVRQNTMQIISEVAKSGVLPPPVAAQIILELSDIPDKQRVIQRSEEFYAQQQQMQQQQMQMEMAAAGAPR